MRMQVPLYGQSPVKLGKKQRVKIEYILPLEHTAGSYITSTITFDWDTFISMVEENDHEEMRPRITNGPIESVYQGIILHEVFSFYKRGLRLPARMTCRDTIIARNEALMMYIRTINNYSFSVVLC